MAEPQEQQPQEIVGATPEIQPEHFADTERYRCIDRLCQYFDGKQYKDRPDFWTGRKRGGSSGAKVPLRERAPCVIYPLPKAAVQQAVRFTFGEGRYPTVKAEPAEDDDAAILGLKLSEDDAKKITRYLSEVTEQAALRPTMRTLLRHGLASKTAVVMLAVRDGRFALDVAHAKDCWPTFRGGDPSGDLESLVWSYQFDKMVPDPKTGKPEYKPHYFRRDITETTFVVYQDAEVVPGKDPAWVIDRAQSKAHGLSFCPAIWIRNMAEQCSGDIDGTGLYAGLEDEFDALNFALSQRHRGIVMFGVPQPWETGVEDDDGPAASGRTARSFADTSGYRGRNMREGLGEQPGIAGAPHGDVASTPARPTGPDQMWSYAGKDVKLGLLETTGKAFEVATNHVNDIQSRLLQAMGVVLLNPAEVAGKGDMSAKFLSMMYTDLLALVDDLRPSWWHYGLCKILNMILRITAVLGGERILVAGAKQVADLMAGRMVAFDGGQMWVPPKLTPAWGDYFSPSNVEIKDGVLAATAAKTAGIIPTRAATEYVAPYFAIDNIDDAVDELAKEADAEQQRQMTLEHAVRSLNGDQNPPGDAGRGSPDEAPPAAGGGVGPAAAGAPA